MPRNSNECKIVRKTTIGTRCKSSYGVIHTYSPLSIPSNTVYLCVLSLHAFVSPSPFTGTVIIITMLLDAKCNIYYLSYDVFIIALLIRCVQNVCDNHNTRYIAILIHHLHNAAFVHPEVSLFLFLFFFFSCISLIIHNSLCEYIFLCHPIHSLFIFFFFLFTISFCTITYYSFEKK